MAQLLLRRLPLSVRTLFDVTGGFSFGRSCPGRAGFILAAAGGCAGERTGVGLMGSEMAFFPGGSSLDSEVGRLIPDRPPIGDRPWK